MEPRAAPGTAAMAIRAATQKQRSARKRTALSLIDPIVV
jgi:hypothetical protein